MEVFLYLNGYEINATLDEQEAIILSLAAGELNRSQFVEWVRTHSVGAIVTLLGCMITVRGVREPIDAEIAAEQVKIRIVTGSTGAFIALLGTIILTSTVLDQDRNPVQDEGITLAARNAVQVFVLNEQQALELLRQAQAGQPVPATPASEEDLSAAESELLEFLQAGNGETDISASGTITPTTTTGSIGE